MAARDHGAHHARSNTCPKTKWVPRPVAAQEVLQLYNDVLRVGRVVLNGKELRWATGEGSERQLHSFCEVFCSTLRALPELARVDDLVLSEAAYWFCKATAIRYMPIIELLQKVSATSLATYDEREGVLVDYVAEVRQGGVMHVMLFFRKEGNLVHVDPGTGDTSARGSLSCLETQFRLPPDFNFAPEYELQLRLPKASTASQIISVCKRPLHLPWRDRRVGTSETIGADGRITILPTGRLCSEYPLCTFGTLLEKGAAPAQAEREQSNDTPHRRDYASLLLRRPSFLRSSSSPASAMPADGAEEVANVGVVDGGSDSAASHGNSSCATTTTGAIEAGARSWPQTPTSCGGYATREAKKGGVEVVPSSFTNCFAWRRQKPSLSPRFRRNVSGTDLKPG